MEGPGQVRVLGQCDEAAIVEFLLQRPQDNLFLTSKLGSDVYRGRLGRILGYEVCGQLTAICLDSGTVFITGEDRSSIPAFATELGPFRRATSILGIQPMVQALFEELGARRWNRWLEFSNIRTCQPVMVVSSPPKVVGDPRVTRLGEEVFQSYLEASIDMYTSEIGSSPFKYGPGYESYVLTRLREGDAFGIVERDKVIFKADLGSRYAGQVQLQGVWVDPNLRGQGISVSALATMMNIVLQEYQLVSLYVNDFNIPALRCYQRLGFRRVGTLATVHY